MINRGEHENADEKRGGAPNESQDALRAVGDERALTLVYHSARCLKLGYQHGSQPTEAERENEADDRQQEWGQHRYLTELF